MNKQELKEELVDLRMKLAEAENQALKVQRIFPANGYHWEFIFNIYRAMQKSDNNLCELAKLLGLDKIDLVEPKRSKTDAK